MLTRRKMLATSAAGIAAPVAAPAVVTSAAAATPKNIVVMAKAIDDIVGAFDPQESYENTNNEVCGNVYRRLVTPDPADTNKIIGDLAEKWTISEDGLTFNFQLKKGVLFDSGKPVTAEDAVFSLQRAVLINKTPAFILKQFDFTADNVEKLIKTTGEYSLQMTLPSVQAPTFVMYLPDRLHRRRGGESHRAGQPDQRRHGQRLAAHP